MALVINLHGPNTNTLGNLTAGALAEMGYSTAAVPSCRREMELAALSGSLTEHTLAQFRSFLRDCGVRPRISGQLDYGYHDIIDIVRSEVALDRKEHPVKDVEKVDVAPDCEKVITGFKNAAISVQEAIKSLPVGSEMRMKLESMVDRALEDGYGGIHIETVRKPTGKTMSLGDLIQSEVDAASRRKDVRDEVTAREVEPAEGRDAVETHGRDEEKGKENKDKEKKNNKEKEKDMVDELEPKKPEYINISFENKDVRVKPYTDRNGKERLRINMTMPKGTVVGDKDLSGMKVSMPAREFMKQDKDAGKAVKYGFRSDRDVRFFKYDEQNQRIDYPGEGDAAIMPSDLAAAVSAAYQGKEAAKPEPHRAASYKYTGLTFAPCDMKVKTVPVEDGPDKNFLLCKLPPHTMVGNQDLGGMIVSKFLTDRQLPYAQSGKPFTASFKTELPVRVYPVNGEDSRDNFDYDYRSPQEFSAGALVAGIEDAYDARLLNAQGYEDKLAADGKEMNPAAAEAKQMLEDRDAAASRQGSKAAALEYHQTGGGEDAPLNDLCDVKSSEAAEVQGDQPYVITGPEPELYDEDVEF